MIKSLAIVSLLSCGVGSQATPHFNNEQINETKHVEQRRLYENSTSTSQQDADLTWEMNINNMENTQNITWSRDVMGMHHDLKINKKWEKYVQTNAGAIHAYTYTNKYLERNVEEIRDGNTITGETNTSGWHFLIQDIYAQSDHKNTLLHQIEFTPYTAIKTSYIDISFTIDVSAAIRYRAISLPGQYYVGLRYNITYLISTQENWAQYFDYSMTQNETSNYDKIEEMTSSANGYSYQKITKTQNITIGEYFNTTTGTNPRWTDRSPQQMAINQQIPIANTKTNYIAIYLEPKIYIAYANENNIITRDEMVNFNGIMYDHQGPSGMYAEVIDNYHGVESTAQDLNTSNVEGYWALDHADNIRAHGTWVPTPTIEVIDVPSVMFQVLGMPWTFISTAFNLTLFPGTPYSVNVGSILAMVLGVLIFVFLIKLIIFKVK